MNENMVGLKSFGSAIFTAIVSIRPHIIGYLESRSFWMSDTKD